MHLLVANSWGVTLENAQAWWTQLLLSFRLFVVFVVLAFHEKTIVKLYFFLIIFQSLM